MSDTPRTELRRLLEDGPVWKPGRLVPAEWQLVFSERAVDQHGTVMRLQQKSIRRHPQGGTGMHLLGFQCTVTVDGQDLDAAEDRLDDEMTALVSTFDDLDIQWDEWQKALYDGALGYQSTVYLTAQKEL